MGLLALLLVQHARAPARFASSAFTSRQAASTAPPSASTAFASSSSAAGRSRIARSRGPSSVGWSFTPLRARGRPLFVTGRFFWAMNAS